jgi:protein-tyrosine phosphatase
MAGFVDVHTHVVPSGDDGATSIEEGLELCRIALEAGTEILFATPHAHAPWDHYPRTAGRDALYEASLDEMRIEVAGWGLDLRRGWEVYPTEADSHPAADLALEGTRAVLIEFPGSWLDIDDPVGAVARAAATVEEAGLVPVLAHPERCRPVALEPDTVRPLSERGWLLCVNAPSLVGGHGTTAERTAWELIDAGLVALVASDGHSTRRPPAMREAYEVVRERESDDLAKRLFQGSALPWLSS